MVIKISGLGLRDNDWTVDSFRPWVLTCIETFGVERSFFATNWPVDRLYSSYGDVVEAYATIISGLTGVLLLFVFKYTSDQGGIRRVRNDIGAHLLAGRLFYESVSVSLRAQGRVLLGSVRLLGLALVPMLVMIVPVSLLLGQLSRLFLQPWGR